MNYENLKVGQMIKSKKGGEYCNYMIDKVSGRPGIQFPMLSIRNTATGRCVWLQNEKDYSRYEFNQ